MNTLNTLNTMDTMDAPARRVIEEILDLGRGAPSGDNTPPWRFEIVSDQSVVVHGFDTRDDCVYDLDGHPSQMSLGALLETLAIAASAHGWRMDACRRIDTVETAPIFNVRFEADTRLRCDPLVACITQRSVQRRPLSTRSLSREEKAALEAAVGAGYQIHWLEGWGKRLATARLMFANAHLRLTLPEAYEVHHRVIEWNARYSTDRVPDQALGVDRMTTRLMRWVMQSWSRVEFFNTWLAGTLAPRIQMDLFPGLACAAHFAILAEQELRTMDDFVAAGRAMQRFWLTATQLGLQLQPEMTPLIFARYVREARPFTVKQDGMTKARRLAERLIRLMPGDVIPRAAFMGRIGAGAGARARSLRLSLAHLTLHR